jgi:hypothetical protein
LLNSPEGKRLSIFAITPGTPPALLPAQIAKIDSSLKERTDFHHFILRTKNLH